MRYLTPILIEETEAQGEVTGRSRSQHVRDRESLGEDFEARQNALGIQAAQTLATRPQDYGAPANRTNVPEF